MLTMLREFSKCGKIMQHIREHLICSKDIVDSIKLESTVNVIKLKKMSVYIQQKCYLQKFPKC